MAITWSVKIAVLDYKDHHVTVSATRTDSADPENPKTYVIPWVHIDTTAQKSAALDAIWAQMTADIAYAAKVAAYAPTVAALEAAAKTNLEARET
jgi:hypothetical protein